LVVPGVAAVGGRVVFVGVGVDVDVDETDVEVGVEVWVDVDETDVEVGVRVWVDVEVEGTDVKVGVWVGVDVEVEVRVGVAVDGELAGFPGKVRKSRISWILVYPSPSESRFSINPKAAVLLPLAR
jgi:hypothetical protein